jgi:hypothetical protein
MSFGLSELNVEYRKVGKEFPFLRTFDVEAPAGQSPIQIGTLSPVTSHELFASAISIEGCSKD